jgi:hypothetical protein
MLAMLAATGCAESSPLPVEVRVHVTSDGSAPVPDAQLLVRGEAPSVTDAQGRATLRMVGKAERVPMVLTCPDGFTAPAGDKVQVPVGVGASDPERTVTLELLCQLELREAVVLVRAAGGATRLPVKVDGVTVGQTDALGFAHVHVRAAPDSEFEVSLDTSANERLSPANPTQRYRLRRSDELFVLDTHFEEPRRPTRKRRADAARRPPKPRNDG